MEGRGSDDDRKDKEEEVWRLGLVYMLGDRDRKWKELKNWMEVKGEDKMLIGGDFNARMGEETKL